MRKQRFLKDTGLPIILVLVTLLIGVFTIGKIFEKQASENIIVKLSKRFMAEVGAILAKFIPVDERPNKFYFGPSNVKAENLDEKEFISFLEDTFEKDKVKVISVKNFTLSKFAKNFQYEDFTEPKLKFLRQRYKLDKLILSSNEELDKFIILRDWLNRIIHRGNPEMMNYNFDSLDILSRAENGETFFCSGYSVAFVQCALSLGFNARYVGLFKGHVVSETWSNEFAKWVVMDAYNNIHYEKTGIPLGALELHDLWENKNLDDVKVIYGVERTEFTENSKEELLSFYHEFYIRMRNDWFSNRYPHWHPKGNSIMNGLEWQDKFTKNNILVARETSQTEDIVFPLNIVSIVLDKNGSSERQPHLILNTFTPNFSHFLIEVDGKYQEKQEKPDYFWNIHKGINRIQIRAINSLDVAGPISEIEFILS